MPNYHATARKTGSITPFTVQFTAKDPTDAIAELCAAAGVQSTNGIVEFEILEVLPRGQYKRAALKLERVTKTAERLAANQAPVEPPKKEKIEKPRIKLSLEERVYVPYSRQAA